MNRHRRTALMPAAAVVLVAGVLGVQVASGGGDFVPLRPVDACAPRTVTSQADGIDGLTERLVLLGVDDAACTLGVSRETLTLGLAEPGARTDAEIAALHDGLLSAVDQLDQEGMLPPASDLVDEALDRADLDVFLETAVRALPDGLVDTALRTDDVLTRTVDELDLRTLLADLDDPDELDAQIQSAVTSAVEAALVARLRDLL